MDYPSLNTSNLKTKFKKVLSAHVLLRYYNPLWFLNVSFYVNLLDEEEIT